MGKWAVSAAFLAASCIAAALAVRPSTPRPQDPVAFLASASQRYPVVELSHVEGTGNANEMDMIEHLFAEPRFTNNIDDVVIEGCNSRYQSIVDRYVAGKEVNPEQLADVCRKTTQIIGGEADRTIPMLIRIVRTYNLKAPHHHLRALAADPPINWSAIHTASQFDVFLGERDSYAVTVIETQVLSKHRKALVVFGGAHLTRWADPHYGDSITMRLERRYPGATYVIYSITGFSRFPASAQRTFYSWPLLQSYRLRERNLPLKAVER